MFFFVYEGTRVREYFHTYSTTYRTFVPSCTLITYGHNPFSTALFFFGSKRTNHSASVPTYVLYEYFRRPFTFHKHHPPPPPTTTTTKKQTSFSAGTASGLPLLSTRSAIGASNIHEPLSFSSCVAGCCCCSCCVSKAFDTTCIATSCHSSTRCATATQLLKALLRNQGRKEGTKGATQRRNGSKGR